MDNYLLMNPSLELEQFSKQLGFTKTFFVDKDFVLTRTESKKELLQKVKEAKKKNLLVIYRPATEELFRFALEKTPVDIILGIEQINPKDSLHFVRGSLDSVTAKIARDNEKILAFSFTDILNSKNQPQLLARMKLNLKLCRKYKVSILFNNFSQEKMELRAAKDLESFFRYLNR